MRRPSPPARSVLAGACAALAVLALAAGAILVYMRVELLGERHFADRVVEAVHDPRVRGAIAERAVEAAIQIEPDLLSARPLLEGAVRAAIDTPAFERLIRLAAINAHRVLFDEDAPTIAVDIGDAAQLIVPAVRSVDPELADQLPRRLQAPLATLHRRDFAAETIQLGDRIRFLAVLLPLVGVALLGAAVWLAPDPRLALRRAPLAVVAAAGIVLLTIELSRPDATRRVRGLTLGQANDAIDAAWDAFVAGLWNAALATGLVALAIVLLLTPAAAHLLARTGAVASSLTATPRDRPARALRGGGVLAAGVAVLTADSEVVRAAGLVLGGALVAAGAADLIMAVAGPARKPARAPLRLPGPGVAALLALLAAGAVATAAILNDDDRGSERAEAAQRPATCNGARALCGRRLNEVVFPGTHNSMSAADEPGWLFANQRRTLRRQLEDGIRLFLIDAHWGVPSGERVRTDLRAEGTSRNRVAGALGPEAVRTAERLAGRVGAGDLTGARQVWLCHSLCELGATKMSAALELYRGWLDEHPGELLVLFIEPSVPAWAIERQFQRAGLLARIARLRRDRPLPTLGQLLDRGRQLVVLGERDTGDLPWYLERFEWVQDTPLGSHSATSCAESRGGDESPIFMINHWVDSFPPRPSANARVNSADAILARVRRCQRRRGLRPAFIAVDHYDRGGIVEAARELNAQPLTQ
jgi:hypothetical protein